MNYNGSNEEISSSILAPWIASVGYLIAPATPLLFFKMVSLAASVYCLLLIWLQRRSIFPADYQGVFVPAVIFTIAISPMFEYWTLGGLETPFQSLLLLAAPLFQVRFYSTRSVADGLTFCVVLVLLSLVRTEGFIYIAASLGFCLAVRERRGLLALIGPSVLAAFATLGLFAIRIVFTGAMWPNPTYAKIGGLFSQLSQGASYLLGYYMTAGPVAWLQGVATLYAVGIVIFYGAQRRDRLSSPELVRIACSSFVVLHEVFVLFAGGDWMEYYRFLVPTIPLKGVLLASAITSALSRVPLRGVAPRTALAAVLMLSIGTVAAYQQTYSPTAPSNCATPIFDRPMHGSGLVAIEARLIDHNCAQGRDEVAVLPFIRNELPKYVRRAGQIRVLTGQAGYFPYHIREQFAPGRVFFIDGAGLTTRAIAQTRSKKTAFGVTVDGGIDGLLTGKAGEASAIVMGMAPNMVYGLNASRELREKLRALGYQLVWDRPNAVIFFRDQ